MNKLILAATLALVAFAPAAHAGKVLKEETFASFKLCDMAARMISGMYVKNGAKAEQLSVSENASEYLLTFPGKGEVSLICEDARMTAFEH